MRLSQFRIYCARIAANEASAVSSIRSITAAETRYAESHRNAGYTCSLSDLRNDIDDRLAEGQKSGYVFELRGCAGERSGTPNTKYQMVASPVTPNQTGSQVFCSDETANIKTISTNSSGTCLENGTPFE